MKCNGIFNDASLGKGGNKTEYICNRCGHKFVGSLIFCGAIVCPKCGKNIHPRAVDNKVEMW